LQGQQGRDGVVFHWGAFDIEGLVWEKMVSISFGGVAGHGERALGAGITHARIGGA